MQTGTSNQAKNHEQETKAVTGCGKPRSADYLKVVEWSEEDGCFVGSAPPIIGGACHGQDEAQVYKELCEIVEEWLAIMERDGLPVPPPLLPKNYSGKFNLRTGPLLHKALAIRAAQAGDGLNEYCVKRLNEAITTADATSPLQGKEDFCELQDGDGAALIGGQCQMSGYSFSNNYFLAVGPRSLTHEQERNVRFVHLRDGSSYEVSKLTGTKSGDKGRNYVFRAKRCG